MSFLIGRIDGAEPGRSEGSMEQGNAVFTAHDFESNGRLGFSCDSPHVYFDPST
jgi:hypothetical protein